MSRASNRTQCLQVDGLVQFKRTEQLEVMCVALCEKDLDEPKYLDSDQLVSARLSSLTAPNCASDIMIGLHLQAALVLFFLFFFHSVVLHWNEYLNVWP